MYITNFKVSDCSRERMWTCLLSLLEVGMQNSWLAYEYASYFWSASNKNLTYQAIWLFCYYCVELYCQKVPCYYCYCMCMCSPSQGFQTEQDQGTKYYCASNLETTMCNTLCHGVIHAKYRSTLQNDFSLLQYNVRIILFLDGSILHSPSINSSFFTVQCVSLCSLTFSYVSLTILKFRTVRERGCERAY